MAKPPGKARKGRASASASSKSTNALAVDFFPWTDQGNANRFAYRYGHMLKFDHSGRSEQDRSWLSWKIKKSDDAGLWWEPASDAFVFRLAVKLFEELRETARKRSNEEFEKWVKTCESGNHLREMIHRASMSMDVAVERDTWNPDPLLLGVQNGVVDLKTGKLRAGRPDDMIRSHSPVVVNPDAKSPVFDNFLDQIMLGRENLIDYLIIAGGYSLTGLTRERCMFILHGSGSNGKSKLLEILEYVTGDYGKSTPAETFAPSHANPDAPRNDLARLAGARFVSAHESELKQGMAEAMVKWITGGDRITCRFGHGRPFEYRPQFKVWLSCNNLPPIKGTDLAIWNRLPPIPFEANFTGAADDKDLIDKLKAEAPGILNRLIQGCLRYQREGLILPDEIRTAAQTYRATSNPVAAFLETCCDVNPNQPDDVKEGEPPRVLHKAYVKYSNSMREKPRVIGEFAVYLESLGYTQRRRYKSGERYWHGISLADLDFQVELDG